MSTQEASKVDDVCRLCLRRDGEFSVFDITSHGCTLSKIIYECVSVDICKGDKLPNVICETCLDSVNSWYSFRDTCNGSQIMLHTWLTESKENELFQGLPSIKKEKIEEKTSVSKAVQFPSEEIKEECLPCKTVSTQTIPNETVAAETQTTLGSDKPAAKPSDKGIEYIKIESTESVSLELFDEHAPVLSSANVQSKESKPENEKDGNNSVVVEVNDSNDKVSDEKGNTSGSEGSKLLYLLTSKDKKGEPLPVEGSSVATDGNQPSSDIPPSTEKNAEVRETTETDPEEPSAKKHKGEHSNNCLENLQIAQSFSIEAAGNKGGNPPTNQNTAPVSVPSSPSVESVMGQVVVKSEPISDDETEDTEDFNYDMPVKQEVMSDSNDLDEGFTDQHQDPVARLNAVVCTTCNRRFSNRSYYLRHLKSKIHKRLCAVKNRNTRPPGQFNHVDDFDSDSSWMQQPHLSNPGCPSEGHFMDTYTIKRTNSNPKSPFKFQCKPCTLYFRSRSEKERHCLSIKHQTFVAKHNSLRGKETMDDEPSTHNAIMDDKIFACPVETCELTFSSGLLLISHMRRHGIVSNMSKELISTNFVAKPPTTPEPPKPVYSCHKCNSHFQSPVGKSNHLRFCKAEAKKFTPPPPEKVSSRPLRKEVKDGSSVKFCPFCQVKFTEEASFLNHIEANHKGSSLYRTLIVDKKAQLKNQNFLLSTRGGIYKCKLCSKSYNFARSLNLHMKNHIMGTEDTVYACKVCKKTFAKLKNYRMHLRSHFVASGSGQFFCISCFQTFKSRSDIARHKALGKCCPIKIKIYSCNICNHSYNKLSSLEEHKQTFHNGSDTPDIVTITDLTENLTQQDTYCKLCDKSYCSKANLVRHIRNAHVPPVSEKKTDEISSQSSASAGEDKFACRYCKREYTQRRYLRHHTLHTCPVLVHKYKKCGTCGKYVPPRLLTKNGCKYCLKYKNNVTTMQKSTVTRSAEAPEEPKEEVIFQCPIGNKQFMSRSSMMNHYSSCKGKCNNNAAFFCRVCKQKYPDIQKYKEHKAVCGTLEVQPSSMDIEEEDEEEEEEEEEVAVEEEEVIKEPLIKEQVVVKHSEKQFSCDHCLRTFCKLKSKIDHEKKCKLCACQACGVQFRSQSLLANHSRKFKGKCGSLGFFSRLYSCLYCSKPRIYQYQLYKHAYSCIKQLLRGTQKYSCPECHLEFSNTDTVKETTTKVQTCILECQKVPHHPSEKPTHDLGKVLCYLCCYAFTSQESFRSHMTIEHGAKSKLVQHPPSAPSSISEDTNEASILNESESMETSDNIGEGEAQKPPSPVLPVQKKRLQCSYCSKNFLHKKNLIFHKSSTHSNPRQRQIMRNKSLKCKVCNRQFVSFPKLKNHEKVHGIIRENVLVDSIESNEEKGGIEAVAEVEAEAGEEAGGGGEAEAEAEVEEAMVKVEEERDSELEVSQVQG